VCKVQFEKFSFFVFNMTVTINTDASYHPTHKVGAYAFWIVCSQGRLVHSGPLKSVKNSQDAELQCIANALHTLWKSSFTNIEHIYVNTDCKFGISAITKGSLMNNCQETVAAIKKIISQLALKYKDARSGHKSAKKFKKFISWRHVPAHTSGSSKRTWVNNKMDELAKKALWESINKKSN